MGNTLYQMFQIDTAVVHRLGSLDNFEHVDYPGTCVYYHVQ